MNERKFFIDIQGGRHFIGTGITICKVENGVVYRAKPMVLEFEEMEPFAADGGQPTLAISRLHSREFLAAWAEALSEADVRPERLVGELAAMKAHLADMRALVFKAGMPGKEGER